MMIIPRLKRVNFKLILKVFFAYITLCGLIMFPCFLFEEAFQTAMFGSWPAKTAQNWELVLKGCDVMKGINKTLKIVNYSFGWIQPLAFLSYRAYSKAADYYVTALEHQVLANSPAAFVGREIEFEFIPSKIIHDEDGIKLVHNRVQILVDEMPTTEKVEIRGIVEIKNNKIIIKAKEN